MKPNNHNGRRRLVKGNHAVVLGAIAGGVDCFFGYPITPQNEIPEHFSVLMPRLGRTFLQAESEVAGINMVYGAAGAGLRAMTSSSGPGFSLMMEGLSYLAGAQLPCLVVDVMRGGPGLANVAPAQGDYFQAVKGGGHGDYRCIVLAPWNVQEMFDLPRIAFDLADRYRMTVILLADGVLGAMLEPAIVIDEGDADFGRPVVPPPKPWASRGRFGRPERNLINSIYLQPEALQAHCEDLFATYAEAGREVRSDERYVDDADVVVVAYGIAARVASSAVRMARAGGRRVGLLRPITLWPFPSERVRALAERARRILVFELSGGQMVEDVRLAVEGRCPVEFFGRMGGVVPAPGELCGRIDQMREPCHA
ncbi:MAG: 3-methyl-2-oxobutanoate dehydrogenase subunit VorB [Phycisphaerae bacterium]